jgi:NAD-dependent deacetylase
MNEPVTAVADALREADVATAFTGAGVSTASGIPSFRGEDGVWETEFDPADFQYGRFRRDPAGFWEDRLALHETLFAADPEPNPAHEALATLEAAGYLDGVVTQNTDGLHDEAGSDRVVELHGTTRRVACDECGRRTDAGPVRERVREGDVPPRCDCGGHLKPDVVLFGERLPTATFDEARTLARTSDVFLAAGSSLVVEPAASLPKRAAEDGTLVLVNLESTPHSGRADVDVRADVTEFLPAVVDELGI